MRRNLLKKLCSALTVAALLSLVVGPSPAAAATALAERVDRDKEAAQKHSEPQDSESESSTGDESLATYIAPASAKPHEIKDAAHAGAETDSSRYFETPDVRSLDVNDISNRCENSVELHRPPHFPNAPPLA